MNDDTFRKQLMSLQLFCGTCNLFSIISTIILLSTYTLHWLICHLYFTLPFCLVTCTGTGICFALNLCPPSGTQLATVWHSYVSVKFDILSTYLSLLPLVHLYLAPHIVTHSNVFVIIMTRVD